MSKMIKTVAVFCALILSISLRPVAAGIFVGKQLSPTEALIVDHSAAPSSLASTSKKYTGRPLPYSRTFLLRSGTSFTELESFMFEHDPDLSAVRMFLFEDAILNGDHLYYLYIVNQELQLGVAVRNKDGVFTARYHNLLPRHCGQVWNGYFFKEKDGNIMIALPISANGPRYESPYNAFKIDPNGVPVEIKP